MCLERFKQVAVAALILIAVPSAAQETATQFARVARDTAGRAVALQTAIVTYVPQDDPARFSVDLVGAVHIADSRYYAELNERFRQYDALLFEMVAPDGNAVLERNENNKGLLSGAQHLLGRFLNLSFQLDEIEYDAANFVHADLSPQELRNSMAERGESLYVYFWRLYFAAMEDFSRDPYGINDVAKLMSSGHGYDLKTAFAFELVNTSMDGDILAGETGSALIEARNERALGVLQQKIDARARRIGIFYGAAHLPDMERRLLENFRLVRQEIVWVDAWQLGETGPASHVN